MLHYADYAEALSRDRLGESVARLARRYVVHRSCGDQEGQSAIDVEVGAESGRRAATRTRRHVVWRRYCLSPTCGLISAIRAAINLDGGNYDPALFNASVERAVVAHDE